jgi:hypothetical protein
MNFKPYTCLQSNAQMAQVAQDLTGFNLDDALHLAPLLMRFQEHSVAAEQPYH